MLRRHLLKAASGLAALVALPATRSVAAPLVAPLPPESNVEAIANERLQAVNATESVATATLGDAEVDLAHAGVYLIYSAISVSGRGMIVTSLYDTKTGAAYHQYIHPGGGSAHWVQQLMLSCPEAPRFGLHAWAEETCIVNGQVVPAGVTVELGEPNCEILLPPPRDG